MLDTWSNPWFFPFLLFFFIFSSKTYLFVTADTISMGQSLTGDQTIVSKGENFVLGFFTPGKSLNYYIGIWYNKFTGQIVVWVANRENPLRDPSSSELKLLENGNLVLLDESKITIWSTNSSSNTSNSTEVILGDDGNLVLRNGLDKSDIIWQSFDYPTDTLLPGGKINFNKLTNKSMQLTSWKNSENPAKGIFSIELQLDPDGTIKYFIQWNESRRYWNSAPLTGPGVNDVPEKRANYIYNFSYITNENGNYFTYNLYDNSIISRFVLGLSGQVQQWSWLEETKEWNLFWSRPKLKCDVYAICGPFSSCDEANSNYCQCLEGFEPRSKDWNLGDRSLGCKRRTPLQCGMQDRFLSKYNTKLPKNRWYLEVGSAEACELHCLNSCSCSAYSYRNGGCSMWGGDLLNVQPSSNGDIGGEDLYLKLASSELWNLGGKKKKASNTGVIVGAVAGTLVLLGLVLTLIWQWRTRRSIGTSKKVQDSLVLRRWRKNRKGTKREIEDLFDLSGGTIKNCKDTTEAEIPIKSTKQGNAPHLPLFDFEVIANATNNFSDANKLGMGGFGHVYKGMLPGGQVIAVKRLSKSSGQGLKEFKNEVILISKLQHRNLVRLLGCCIEGEEKMLLYEYMPNKSLDSFLFDPTKQVQLNWPKRFHIVEGIARGLLYLHRDSRLKIIHRDLKAGNILLDDEMNPKISDFGMARIFGGNQTLANTNRVVGTYGYMSPEYAMEGRFSEKSDVFSFGVLLLEIVSGKRINQFYLDEQSLSLVGFAWRLWNESKEIELMDPTLRDSYSAPEILRCIHVGLLCVQGHAAERPTMSNIVKMLLGMDTTQLPTPRQPGFTIESGLSLASQEMCSINNVTITEESGR